MAFYLQMDGVDDRLQIPRMSVDSFEVIIKPRPQGWEQYIYFGGKQVNRTGSNTDAFNVDFQAVYVDGVQVTSNTAFIKLDTKQVLKGVLKTGIDISGTSSFIYNNSLTAFMEGDLFDVKFYNGATLVAHYDMNTQTVQDQSGNGNHATLTGGTWVEDGTGGGTTPIVVESGDFLLNLSTILTTEPLAIKQSSANMFFDGTLTANGSRVLNGGVAFNLDAGITLEPIAIKENGGVLQATFGFVADGEVISEEISFTMSLSTNLDAIATKIVNAGTTLTLDGNLLASGSLIHDGEAIFNSEFKLINSMGRIYLQTIYGVVEINRTMADKITLYRKQKDDINI